MRLYIILTVLLLLSCNKEKTKSNNKDTPLISNSITSLTIDKEEYIVTENSKLVIEPVIVRENKQTYEDLLFEWNINGVILNEKILDYTIPTGKNNETLKCFLSVRNKSDNQTHRVDFKIKVVNPFGYGYYFLCKDEKDNSLIAHLNSENYKDIIFNSSAISDYKIGNEPKLLTKKLIYNYPQKNYYEINIVTGKGDFPYIKCNNTDLSVINVIPNKSGDLLFSPYYHHISKREQESFLSDGKYVIYENNRLYFETNSSYYWSNIIEGRNHLYMFDSKSSKYYMVKPDKNGYYNDIIPIINCPTMSGETIVGHFWKLLRLDGDEELSESIFIITSSGEKLNFYNLKYDSKTLSLTKIKSGNVESSNITTAMSDDICYIAIGNTIYTTTEKENNLKPFLSLQNDITQIIISNDETKLIATTYNNSETRIMKGSVSIIDINSKKVTTFENTLTKCISISDCTIEQ